jgi:hypothetical protein
MVAMGMATVVMTAFAYASNSAVQAVHTARLNQQAADLATQRLEQIRSMPYGSMGHDPAGIAPDPHLVGDAYNGEPLVTVAGGIESHITTKTQNNFDYTIYAYVTQPVDALNPDSRRVTVLVEWAAYGESHSKTMSGIVTLTQRGLPLPEFKLTPVGPSTITVNRGARAAFGFELTNQGAPDQWNVTATLPGYTIYRDNGDDVFNATDDIVLMSDNNGDGQVDTGRLDPKQSVVFWVVRDVPADAALGSTSWDLTAVALSEGTAGSAEATLTSILVVTDAVITASPTPTPSTSASPSVTPTATPTATPTPTPSETSGDTTICEATTPAPVPVQVTGYSRKAYVLHNTGSTSWPQFPLPETGSIPGSLAMTPMYMDMNAESIPADRMLPEFSTNLMPAGTSGRLLYSGGSFSSTSASDVLNFRTINPNRTYTGSMVLRLWVKPEPGSMPVSLAAQVYQFKTSNSTSSTRSTVSQLLIDPFECSGWQEVWFQFPVSTFTTGSKTVLGVKVWNTGTEKAVVAYDHGAFPATFTVVEK